MNQDRPPQPHERDEDERFADIVARLRDEDDHAAFAPPPVKSRDDDPLTRLPPQWRTASGEPTMLTPDDGEFEPPELDPLPAGDLHFWGALIGLIGGPLWLAYLFIFERYAHGLWWFLAVALGVAGFVLLVLRQPKRRDPDWDDEVDGARL